MSEKQVVIRRGLFSFGLILAIGLVFSTLIAAETLKEIKLANQSVTVKGYAEKKITSDRAVWTGGFSVRGPELAATYGKLSASLETVLAYLAKSGVRRADVTVSAADTKTQMRRLPNGQETYEVENYVLSQAVTVESTDTGLVSRLSDESTVLMKDGIEFSSGSPSYFYTKLGDLKFEMLGQAAKDARNRAEQLVASSGSQVGALRYAEQGVFQITGPYSTDVSGYGVNDTDNIEKVVKAIVTIQYAIR